MTRPLILASVCLLTFASLALGETSKLSVSRDTCLFERDPDFNMGTQRDLPAGTLGSMGENRRSRLLFQVDLTLPDKAEIISARYKVEVTMSPEVGGANSTFALHRMLTPWNEGDKRNDLPGGDLATDGETTWLATFHPDMLWASPGGELGTDYATEPSATGRVRGVGSVVLEFNAQGLEDIRSMLADSESNHGWMLLTQEEGRSKTARRFAAREHRTTPPILEIEHEGGTVSEAEPFVASVAVDPDSGEWIISAPADPDKGYTLQCSTTLESTDWKNQVNEGELSAGEVTFRKLMNESQLFARIVEGS